MDQIEERIIDFCKKYDYIKVNRLAKLENISRDIAKTLLDDLKSRKILYKEGQDYYLIRNGIIQVKERGFGFITVDDSNEDYYVPADNINGALNGDKVSFIAYDVRGNKKEAFVLKITEHGNKFVVGEVVKKMTSKGITYYVDSKVETFDCKCYIEEKDLNDAVPGNIVSAQILSFKDNNSCTGIVTKIIGYVDDPGMDISIIASKHNFFVDFPDSVIEEIKLIPNSINAADYPNRKDFRDKLIITIDGDDSKDFDDAVNVEILPNGNYYLGVYIADVAEYVKENTTLDNEALFRATSVYLADRVIPMLPHKLSNGICSLNEGEDRLVLACEMEYSPAGELLDYKISEGIIRSHRRMTYNNVNKILKQDEETIEKYKDIYQLILNMEKLSKLLRGLRTKAGAIDFDVPEYKVIMDEKGNPVEFQLRTRDVAEMLIEDFMLAANQTVAYHMANLHLPCVYRIHENPDDESVAKVYQMINSLGYKVFLPKNKILPKDIQKTMTLVKGSESFYVVNQMMLRAMAKAKYSESNIGHYGLAMRYYCHFTSPIRRYPDLMVHRLIKELIIHTEDFDDKFTHFASMIHEIATQSSIKERAAIECEREVVDMLMAQFMENHIKEVYEGMIDSITKFGMFVLLDDGVEGLVHISTLKGYFNFDEIKMRLYSSRREYKVGDKVKIIVTGASKAKRRVDFMLLEDYNETFGV